MKERLPHRVLRCFLAITVGMRRRSTPKNSTSSLIAVLGSLASSTSVGKEGDHTTQKTQPQPTHPPKKRSRARGGIRSTPNTPSGRLFQRNWIRLVVFMFNNESRKDNPCFFSVARVRTMNSVENDKRSDGLGLVKWSHFIVFKNLLPSVSTVS